MAMTQTLTQTGLRLTLVTLEMQSMIDRSVKSTVLHDIVEFCVPRRLLRFFTIWAQRGNDGLMRLNVTVDYDEHDRQITLNGDGLPDGIAGTYAAECGTPEADRSQETRPRGCPNINKAIDLFAKTARDRGLFLTWAVGFTERHAELYKKFHFGSGNTAFRDRTVGTSATTLIHSEFPELRISAAVAPESPGCSDMERADREK